MLALRAGDVVTRSGQIHVYQSLLAKAEDGYWQAGELLEGDARTARGAYAWALWRPQLLQA